MIEFIEEPHIYLINGIITPSVSEILHYIFPNKYKGISEEILNKKAIYGSTVHEAIEYLEQDKQLPVLNYSQEFSIREYQRLKEKNSIKVISQEQMINYENYYCGRFDMIAQVGNDMCLCDIKTTSELDEEYLSYQLSYYELAYGKTFDKLYAIWLPKNGYGKLKEIKRKPKEILIAKLNEFLKTKN